MTAARAQDFPALTHGAGTVRSLELKGPAGKLEAILNEGSPDASFAALVCHPHPKGGGTMHNKVVYHAMKALNAPQFGLNLPVLRFNFRGTGLSEGKHDGAAESEDVVAALRWLENAYKRPVVAAGFSFGAAMVLRACCAPALNEPARNLRGLVALGLPTRAEGRQYQYAFLTHCSLPKLFLSGEHDQFAPAADLRSVAATTAEPKKLVLLPGADHFFDGRLGAMQNELARWLKELVP
ncbi:MAG TPA: alpha/beta fold hydrolase [Terracidiphilus sp.]|nr:alpha/beta fold hydrolase [Terracidiphilus sp.]